MNLYICITVLLVVLSNRSLICMHLTSEIEIPVFRIYHGSEYLRSCSWSKSSRLAPMEPIDDLWIELFTVFGIPWLPWQMAVVLVRVLNRWIERYGKI